MFTKAERSELNVGSTLALLVNVLLCGSKGDNLVSPRVPHQSGEFGNIDDATCDVEKQTLSRHNLRRRWVMVEVNAGTKVALVREGGKVVGRHDLDEAVPLSPHELDRILYELGALLDNKTIVFRVHVEYSCESVGYEAGEKRVLKEFDLITASIESVNESAWGHRQGG